MFTHSHGCSCSVSRSTAHCAADSSPRCCRSSETPPSRPEARLLSHMIGHWVRGDTGRASHWLRESVRKTQPSTTQMVLLVLENVDNKDDSFVNDLTNVDGLQADLSSGKTKCKMTKDRSQTSKRDSKTTTETHNDNKETIDRYKTNPPNFGKSHLRWSHQAVFH